MAEEAVPGVGVPIVAVKDTKKQTKRKTKKKGVTFVVKNVKNPKLPTVGEFISSLNTGDGSEKISGKIIIG